MPTLQKNAGRRLGLRMVEDMAIAMGVCCCERCRRDPRDGAKLLFSLRTVCHLGHIGNIALRCYASL